MNLGLLGAENIIGHLLVQKALNQGDTVYAYVRCPEKVKIRHIKLHLVQTKFSDNQDIKKVIVNADVMVSTLNPYTKIATKETKTPLSDTHKSIIQTMETWQKKRLITLATPALIADEDPHTMKLLLLAKLMKSFLPLSYQDVNALGFLLKSSALDWTVIRIIGIRKNLFKKKYATAVGDTPFHLFVSPQNIATCLYDVAKENKFIRQMPIVFNQ